LIYVSCAYTEWVTKSTVGIQYRTHPPISRDSDTESVRGPKYYGDTDSAVVSTASYTKKESQRTVDTVDPETHRHNNGI
jgi:hypothetical protein